MLDEVVSPRVPVSRRRLMPAALLASCFLLAPVASVRAQDPALPPITIGAGVRTGFVHTDTEEADVDSTDRFLLDSVRLYVNGSATKNIKFMFNTEYDGASNHLDVLDAVARFEFSDKFNIWAGRFLPPSDRANLYGPYYAHHWASSPTACRTAIRSSARAATTASRTGASSAR